MILVTGGSASGKSAFAEKLLTERAAADSSYKDTVLSARTYLATMASGGAEAQERIARHRRQREGMGFSTVECPANISTIIDKCKGAVLLEDLGNLVANEMFANCGISPEATVRAAVDSPERACPGSSGDTVSEHIFRDLRLLDEHCGLLVVVTDEVFSDGVRYDPETTRYLEQLGALNVSAARFAQEVWEVICGIPVRRK